MSDQSTARPATQLPNTMPTPRVSRNTGTAASGRPPTWVAIGATYEYIANMPPKPIAPATIANQTCGLRSACSSRRPVASGLPGQSGTNASTMAMVSAASPVTTQYDARQPRVWPSQVAAGTPTTLATGRPISTRAMARPRRSGATMLAATSEATPK